MSTHNIAIIGLGLIGGSFAKAIKQSDLGIIISAYDRPEILVKALAEGVIDKLLSDIDESLHCETIFLALPIEESLQTLKNLSPRLNTNQVISDLCSVKGIFADEWNKLSSKGTYIGAHPMTGKEKSGYDNSDALLFENSVFIVCKKNNESESFNKYLDLVRLTGARITLLDPYLHDKIISRVSHLPQLLSILTVNQASAKEGDASYLDFAAGGFRDMTRIASSSFLIWESIIRYNKNEILQALDIFQDQISRMKKLVEDEKFKEINGLFEKARLARNEIPFNSKGFIDPLFDINIFVKDQPGMISKISTILFENDINIKDIELLKIREGTGGNFKFYFESELDAKKAKELIENIGFHIQ